MRADIIHVMRNVIVESGSHHELLVSAVVDSTNANQSQHSNSTDFL